MPRRSGSAVRARFGACVFLLVIGALVGVYTLPRPVRVDLALFYSAADYVPLFASHYVHFRLEHLLTNLLVFAVVEPLALVLSLHTADDWLFPVAVTTYLVVFPPVLSGLNLAVVRPHVAFGFGFSGINMAFLGLLPVVLFRYLGSVDERVRPGDALGAFFVGSGIAAGLAVPIRWVSLGLVAVSLAAAGVSLYGLHRRAGGLDHLGERVRTNGRPSLVVTAVLLYPSVAVAGFAPSGQGGSVVDLYTHFVGFGLGFAAAYLTARSEARLNRGWRRLRGD